MSAPTYEQLAEQLSKGLDLCVRARSLDVQDRTNMLAAEFPDLDLERLASRNNAMWPEAEITTRSATIPLWVQDQYDRDLAAWEAETRSMLAHLFSFKAPSNA